LIVFVALLTKFLQTIAHQTQRIISDGSKYLFYDLATWKRNHAESCEFHTYE